MACRPIWVGWLGLLAGVLSGVVGAARGQELTVQQWVAGRVPFAELPANVRDKVRQVVEHPTLFSHGRSEVFAGNPAVYRWLLDHPEAGCVAWRRLGARCLTIQARGQGRYGWADGPGNDIQWRTVHEGPQQRIWFAQGHVHPAPLLPAVPVRAVVVWHHLEGVDRARRTLIHHQADIFIQTDSKTMVLAARLLGESVPRATEQCLAQMELFFSGLVWYVERHPERAEALGIPLRQILD